MANELDPRTRKEVFLAGMLYGDPTDLPDPETRDELYMKAIGEAIKAGGLPDPSEASEGDVLAIGSDGPEWTTPSGGVEIWQHTAYITPKGTTITAINDVEFFAVFISNSATFDYNTAVQYAFMFTPRSIAYPTGYCTFKVTNGKGIIQYGTSGTSAINISSVGNTPRIEWLAGESVRII